MLRLMGWSAFAYDTQVSSKAASENPADGLGSGARADCLTVGGVLPTEPRPQGPMDATRGLRTAGRDVQILRRGQPPWFSVLAIPSGAESQDRRLGTISDSGQVSLQHVRAHKASGRQVITDPASPGVKNNPAGCRNAGGRVRADTYWSRRRHSGYSRRPASHAKRS